jgi:hypothetical protein
MTLAEFSEGLFRHLPGGRESTERPFVCDGSPLNCSIFIVGYNNKIGIGPIRQVWSDHTGFDKLAFEKLYIQNGGKPNNRTTNRYWINLISKAVGQCVETNIFSKDSKGAHSLPANDQSTEVFDYNFKKIKPSALFCFNIKTIKELEGRLGVSIPLISDGAELLPVTMFDHSFHIIGHDHGWLSTAAPYFDRLVDKLRFHRKRRLDQ